MNEYIEEIKRIAEDFSKANPKWKSVIYTEAAADNLAPLERALEDKYFETIKHAIKQKQDIDSLNKEISQILGNQVFVEVHKELDSMISVFEKIQLVSEIENSVGFISDCFDRAILRRDDDFFDEYENYGFESVQKMVTAINTMSNIVINHILFAYSKKTAEKEFKRITEFEDSICRYYAEKYDNNFEKLQMNLVLRFCRENADQIRDFVVTIQRNTEK